MIIQEVAEVLRDLGIKLEPFQQRANVERFYINPREEFIFSDGRIKYEGVQGAVVKDHTYTIVVSSSKVKEVSVNERCNLENLRQVLQQIVRK